MKPRRGQRRGVRLLAALTLLMVGSGVTPFVTAPTPFAVEEARAADATITDCSAATGFATFSDTLDAVQADGGGTITFDCTGTFTFTGQQTITTDVTIIGNGIVFDGGNNTRLFRVVSGASLNLQNLTVQNGRIASAGGAIDNDGTLEITASTFSGNSTSGTISYGGAIYNDGMLEITASTFSDNSTSGSGNEGGAIYNSGTLEITASTFSENASSAGGAAFHLESSTNTTITASTISGNTAPGGEAAIVAWGALTIKATIVAENTNGNCRVNGSGSITSNGSNLSDDTTCNFTNTGDIQGAGAVINLEDLADNGGPTQTMLPQPGSDAIANADCTLSSAEDQRGVVRPTSGTNCTMGAVELAVFVCASRSTGAASVPGEDGCGPGGQELVLPGEVSLTLCIRRGTGAVSVRSSCPASWNQHVVPDDGPFEYCASRHTGALRAMPASGCASNERPGVIPG